MVCSGRGRAQPDMVTADTTDARQPTFDMRIRLSTLSPLISFCYFRPRV